MISLLSCLLLLTGTFFVLAAPTMVLAADETGGPPPEEATENDRAGGSSRSTRPPVPKEPEKARPTESKSIKWGAVARKGPSFTAHWNHDSKDAAQEAALEACRKFDGKGECQVVAAFTSRWCWALARSNKDRTKWNWSTGSSIDTARTTAKAACDERAGEEGCEISLQFCSDGSDVFSDRK